MSFEIKPKGNFSSSKRIFLELVEKYKIPFSERRLQHKETNSGQSRFMSKVVSVFFEFEKVGGSKTIISYWFLSCSRNVSHHLPQTDI